MMGPHHAATGAAAWLALASDVTVKTPETLKSAVTWLPDSIHLGASLLPGMTLMQILVSTILAAGAALLPDIDHHNATIARSLPPLTTWTAKAFGSAAGGHRHGTHTWFGVILFAVASFLLSFWVIDISGFGTVAIGAGLFATVLMALFLVTFKIISKRSGKLAPWIVSLGLATVIALNAPDTWYWLPLATLVGAVIHILGDFLTTGGIPWFKFYWMGKVVLDWTPPPGNYMGIVIKKNGFVSFPILGNTGSGREWALATVIGGYALLTFSVVVWQFIVETTSSWS